MSDLIALAERVEAALAGEQEALLREAYSAVFPEPKRGSKAWGIWARRTGSFVMKLGADAFESAAMTLVPSKGFGSLIRGTFSDGRVGFVAVVMKPSRAESEAATAALALTAAALRAHASAKP